MRVIIMRGIPGSGKSTHAKTHYPTATICSADNYFMDNGVYRFNPTKLGEAHAMCMKQYLDALNARAEWVVVDNTNIRVSEITPYTLVARAMGYDVEIVRYDCPAEIGAARNAHGVPLVACIRMQNAMEALPGFLGVPETIISVK